jgi:hypothetical protein
LSGFVFEAKSLVGGDPISTCLAREANCKGIVAVTPLSLETPLSDEDLGPTLGHESILRALLLHPGLSTLGKSPVKCETCEHSHDNQTEDRRVTRDHSG